MNYAPTLLILATLSTGLLIAQEEGDRADPAEAFAKVYKEWKELDSEIGGVIEAYRKATDDERPKLVTRYGELVKRSAKLIPVLRETGLAAYKAAPNSDEDVIGTLVGLVANDVRQDEYESAISLGVGFALADLLLFSPEPLGSVQIVQTELAG